MEQSKFDGILIVVCNLILWAGIFAMICIKY